MSKIKYLIIIFLLIFGIKSVSAFDNSDKIYDYAQVLTENEEIKIKKEIDNYINKHNLDMVIVTVKYYTQGNLQDYINEFYNKNEFGIGINKDGIIIVLDLKNNVETIDIKTFGLGKKLYSKNEIEGILNEIKKENRYNDKFFKFISYSNMYIKENKDIYNTDDNIFNSINWIEIIILSAIIPTIIIIIILLINKKEKKENKVNYYIKENSIVINKKEDKFKTTNTKKNRLKTKGFTLVELLVVIIILGIISTITVPIVLNLIEDVKIRSYDQSVENVIRAAKLYDLESELNLVKIEMDQNIYEQLKNTLNGTKPEEGTIYLKASSISDEREIAFALQYGPWCYTKAYGEKKYTRTKTKECIVPMDYLMATSIENSLVTDLFLGNTYGITREQVEKIITVPTNKVPEELKEQSWDVSEKQNRKVMAWYEKYQNENGEDRYTVYLGQEGGVKTNTESSYLFSYLTAITDIDLMYLDTSNVENMEGLFYNSINLTQLDVSKFNTSKVTNMKLMFSAYYNLNDNKNKTYMKLQEIKGIENFNTSKVQTMLGMFYRCSSISQLDLNNFDTSLVNNIQSMFQDCSNLIKLEISNFDTKQVTTMQNLFYNCSKLEKIDVSKFNTVKTTTMENMFYGCSSIESLDLSHFNTKKLINRGVIAMFSGCSSLKKLDVSNFNTETITSMQSLFQGCENLESLDLSKWDTTNVGNMIRMFSNCKNLKELNLGNWEMVNTKYTSHMFGGCNSLENLDLSNWNTSNLQEINYMFGDCWSLTTLNLNNWNTQKVTKMNSMFQNCYNLVTLDLSDFKTNSVTTMGSMFQSCTNLKTVYLNNFDVSNVTTLSNMFIYANSIEKVYINKTWTFKEGANTTNIYGIGTTGNSTVDWIKVISDT